jgi:hypothetical protein
LPIANYIIADFQLPIANFAIFPTDLIWARPGYREVFVTTPIGNWQSEVGNQLGITTPLR